MISKTTYPNFPLLCATETVGEAGTTFTAADDNVHIVVLCLYDYGLASEGSGKVEYFNIYECLHVDLPPPWRQFQDVQY